MYVLIKAALRDKMINLFIIALAYFIVKNIIGLCHINKLLSSYFLLCAGSSLILLGDKSKSLNAYLWITVIFCQCYE